MVRVSNNKARDYVNGFKEFQGSNMFGKWLSKAEDNQVYVVYSYGSHFPMYIYDDKEQKWVGNKDKYSCSTTRHQSQGKPSGVEIMWLNTNEMQEVINNYGIVGYLINKAQN
jgi:hypothetical protein